MNNSRDEKLIVIKNVQETRRIAIHSPNMLHGINPSTFAGCEHYSIEDPTISCLVFSKIKDNVSINNKQYVVEDIISLQDEIVRKCYNSYDYHPREDEIGTQLAEIVLGNNLFCESGSLGLAQNLENVVLVTDDQMLYATAEFSGIRNCGITVFLAASEYTWEQLLNASKRLRKMNFANYLPFGLYKATVDSMLEEGVDIEIRSIIIQNWVRTDTEEEPTQEHKDIILALYKDVFQNKLDYLNPNYFLSNLASNIIKERNPGLF